MIEPRKRVLGLRNMAEWTRREFSNRSRVPESVIGQFERGERTLSPEQQRLIGEVFAQEFGFEIRDVFPDYIEKNPPVERAPSHPKEQ